MLKFVRPSVLYVFGSKSLVATADVRAEKMAVTGTGFAGSGGAKLGQVTEVIVSGSHFAPMESVGVKAVAAEVAGWLGGRIEVFRATEKMLQSRRSETSLRERQMVSKQWTEIMKAWDGNPISKASKL